MALQIACTTQSNKSNRLGPVQ